MRERVTIGAWAAIAVVAIMSAVLAWTQLSGLPDLGVLLGPDLTVRAITVDRQAGADDQPFQRGDALRAVSAAEEWHSVDDLQELRAVLPGLVERAEPPEFEDSDPRAESEWMEQEGWVVLDYQIHRPEHRFTLALQGEGADPTRLPPGIEEEDKLVEVDGRLLPGKVGSEGIRSVASSRPDAVLGIERPNAEFFGQLKLDAETTPWGVALIFILVLGGVVAVALRRSTAVSERQAICVGLETVALGWLLLLVGHFQWVLADPWLAIGVAVALIMFRPLAIASRRLGEGDEFMGGVVALGLGGALSALMLGLLLGGVLANPEEVLHAAGIVFGLFVVYELASSGMEESSVLSFEGQQAYLTAVVIFALLAAVVTVILEPVAFQEERWRWFSVLVPSLLWVGDTMYVVKYGSGSALGEVASRGRRHRLLEDYFEEMGEAMPMTTLRLVAGVEGAFQWAIRSDAAGVRVDPVEASLGDAAEILWQEQARIPLPDGVDRQNHPMGGIAQSMGLSLALPLTPPSSRLELSDGDIDFVLIGERMSSDGDIPTYASTETLDQAQELWKAPVASAATIEVMSRFSDWTPTETTPSKENLVSRQELEAATSKLEDEKQRRTALEGRHESTKQALERCKNHHALRAQIGIETWDEAVGTPGLLEAELEEGLAYLLETEEPVVFAGAIGVGKAFSARWAHELENRGQEQWLSIDMAVPGAVDRLDDALGLGESEGLLSGFEGSFLVRGAQWLSDGSLLALCHRCEEASIRLYLAFDAEDAEERSVFEDRPASLDELLGHREVVIPSLQRRSTILRGVLEFWLEEWAYRYDKPIDGFSRMALEALEAYDYPGEISEAVEVVRRAVVHCDQDVVDRENLPVEVRRARPL